MNGKIKYKFSAKTWQHASPGGWHFVSLPNELAKEIREALRSEEEGWGRLKATAKIGNSEWKILPLKADIRKKEDIEIGKDIEVVSWI